MTRTTRGVSFNLEDPIESKLNDYFKDVNFSKFVKRLLEKELFGSGSVPHSQKREIQQPKELVQDTFPKQPSVNSFI
jgi:hypothetical protein